MDETTEAKKEREREREREKGKKRKKKGNQTTVGGERQTEADEESRNPFCAERKINNLPSSGYS